MGIGLYGQVMLRLFITLNCLVSIWFWRRGEGTGKKRRELRPSFLAGWQRALLIVGLGAVAVPALSKGLIHMLDYSSMYVVIVGSLLIVKKKTDSWGFFLVGDATSLPLFLLSASYMNIFFGVFSVTNNATALYQWRNSRK